MNKYTLGFLLLLLFSCKKKDTIIPPVPPTTLTATAISTSEITLAWKDNATNEQGFKVERRTGNGAYQEIATVNADIISYKDAGLSKKTTYTYRIYAFNKGGKSTTYSNEATAETLDELPAAATNLVANAVSTSQIELTWDDKSTNETGFKIERKLKDGTFWLLATLGVNASAYSDKNLSPNTIYIYRVYPFNETGNAPYSNEAGDTTLPDITSGLVAFYPFSGNAGDSSGNGNHGTVNGATLAPDRTGKTNTAYHFDNYSEIQIRSNDMLNLTGDMGFSAWFRIDSLPQFSTSYTIIGKRDDDVTSPFVLEISQYLWDPTRYNVAQFISAKQSQAQLLYTQTKMPVKTWSHIAFTITGNTLKIYLNGNEILSTIINNSLRGPNTANMKIGGGYTPKPYQYFLGSLDEIRLYNRPLSITEITYLATH